MTRFWITLEQVADFVLMCLSTMQGGEVFVPRMPSMRVTDIARGSPPTRRPRRSGSDRGRRSTRSCSRRRKHAMPPARESLCDLPVVSVLAHGRVPGRRRARAGIRLLQRRQRPLGRRAGATGYGRRDRPGRLTPGRSRPRAGARAVPARRAGAARRGRGRARAQRRRRRSNRARRNPRSLPLS